TFTTVAQKPLIVNDIDDLTVAYGDSAVFTVTASSTESATWYKVGQAESLAAGAKYSMAVVPNGDKFDAQLVIADMSIADEGIYYAVLGNTATTETTPTREAELLAGRLMGWWEFNGGITDSVTTVEPAATAHEGTMITTGTTDPYVAPLNYSAGIIDQALVFAPPAAGGDQNNSAAYFAAVGSDTDMNFTPRGFSVAVWFKTSHAGWGAIVGKGRRNTNGWIMEHNGDTISLVFRGGGTATLNSADIADGQWHLLVGSYNPAKGKVEMYASSIDDAGQYRLKYASADSSAPGIVTDQPMTIGIELDPTFSNVYTMVYGEVDDVKMYSYALSDMEIAELLFYPVVNAPVCVESQIGDKGKYDFNNDCQVNVLDFAYFAQFWLESSIYTDVQ
ncbi:MAG: hypothetical protein JXM68_05940, partial [Sedimentisphaerales bacterium]|nr:hypothetical protein [Sedimentisphaerales bacterium]